MDDEAMTLGEIGRRVEALETDNRDTDIRLGKLERSGAAMGVQVTNLETSVKNLTDNSQKQLQQGYWTAWGVVISIGLLVASLMLK